MEFSKWKPLHSNYKFWKSKPTILSLPSLQFQFHLFKQQKCSAHCWKYSDRLRLHPSPLSSLHFFHGKRNSLWVLCGPQLQRYNHICLNSNRTHSDISIIRNSLPGPRFNSKALISLCLKIHQRYWHHKWLK